jgi:hypothetical protein
MNTPVRQARWSRFIAYNRRREIWDQVYARTISNVISAAIITVAGLVLGIIHVSDHGRQTILQNVFEFVVILAFAGAWWALTYWLRTLLKNRGSMAHAVWLFLAFVTFVVAAVAQYQVIYDYLGPAVFGPTFGS